MKRVLIHLTEQQIKDLKLLSKKTGQSRAAIIRLLISTNFDTIKELLYEQPK